MTEKLLIWRLTLKLNRLRIAPDHYFVLAISLSLLCHILIPVRQIILYPFWLIGLVIATVGYLISNRANAILVKHQTGITPFERPVVLVTSGPFGFSRNPVYLGMALILLGIAWSLGSITPFIFPIIFVVFISIFVIPDEERELDQIFKKKYSQYKRKARRWI